MTEQHIIDNTDAPRTRAGLADDLRALGVTAGQTVLLHSKLSEIGWVVGGPVTVVHALLDVLTETGTLMVPTHSAGNSDPKHWVNPPVPPDWWQPIRDHMPAYDPAITLPRQMGQIVEVVRNWPAAQRSDHPQYSFAAVGAQADALVGRATSIGAGFGDDSPLGALYQQEGYVLLLGVGYDSNTSLHLAEHRGDFSLPTQQNGAAMQVDGVRQWVAFEGVDYDADDFEPLGLTYEQERPHAVKVGPVGSATSRLMRMRPLVDFGAKWLAEHRITNNS